MKKVCGLFIVLFGVSVLTFALASSIRGTPAEVVLRHSGIDPTLAEISLMEARLGLDKSVVEQYLT